MGKRAVDYRNQFKIPHDLGTAVNVVAMVFGNMGDDSGTGVAFTRNPSTGAKEIFGEFLPNAQGEDVVAGIRTPMSISKMREMWPTVYQQFEEIADRLEHTYKDVQDLEFTVERGKLYMLQTRNAKRTGKAAVVTAVDMVAEGLITKDEALRRIQPTHVQQILVPQFDPASRQSAGAPIGKGLAASPGAAVGKVVFDPGSVGRAGGRRRAGRPGPQRDVARRLSRHGARGRHPDLARRLVEPRGGGRPSDGQTLHRRRRGHRHRRRAAKRSRPTAPRCTKAIGFRSTARPGEVFAGRISTIEPDFKRETGTDHVLLSWADDARTLGVSGQRRHSRRGYSRTRRSALAASGWCVPSTCSVRRAARRSSRT